MLIGFAVFLVSDADFMADRAAFLLSMVFCWCGWFSWGFVAGWNGNHA